LLGEDEEDEGEEALSSQRVAPACITVPEQGSALESRPEDDQGRQGNNSENPLPDPHLPSAHVLSSGLVEGMDLFEGKE